MPSLISQKKGIKRPERFFDPFLTSGPNLLSGVDEKFDTVDNKDVIGMFVTSPIFDTRLFAPPPDSLAALSV
jgi:hypothetical protein